MVCARTVFLLMFLVFAVPSCTTESEDAIKLTGTVVFVTLEAGFYGITGGDGRVYEPTNLPVEFHTDRLRV